MRVQVVALIILGLMIPVEARTSFGLHGPVPPGRMTMLPDTARITQKMTKGFEGFRGVPYKDSNGNWSIGYGRNMKAHPYTEVEAAQWLERHLDEIQHEVLFREETRDIYLGLNEVRRSALVQMAYQMGFNGLVKFTGTLAKMKAGDYAGAAANIRGSLWYRQTRDRAEIMATMFETGEWPTTRQAEVRRLLGSAFVV
jgi:lysozyme